MTGTEPGMGEGVCFWELRAVAVTDGLDTTAGSGGVSGWTWGMGKSPSSRREYLLFMGISGTWMDVLGRENCVFLALRPAVDQGNEGA